MGHTAWMPSDRLSVSRTSGSTRFTEATRYMATAHSFTLDLLPRSISGTESPRSNSGSTIEMLDVLRFTLGAYRAARHLTVASGVSTLSWPSAYSSTRTHPQ